MRVLITGSSGQIGSNLGLHLLAQGHEVFGVDIRPNRWTTRIPTLLQDLGAPTTRFTDGIGDAAWPRALDLVVHLAAHAKVHELVEQPLRALDNIGIAFNVLEFCRQNRLPLVFSSSREIYGDIRRHTTDEAHADFSFMASPYAASKVSGEALIYSYAQCYDLPYLVFRFSNVYGRYDNDHERMERVIPLFIREIGAGRPVTVYGRDKVLDFTYVDDCVRGVSAGIERLLGGSLRDQTINLACGEGHSLTAMAGYIGAALDVAPDLRIEPSRSGEVTHYVANIDKAREMLDYAPQVSLREGIRRAVAWSQVWATQAASHQPETPAAGRLPL